MRVIAYRYHESHQVPPYPMERWGYTIDQLYEDRAVPSEPAYRPQLDQLQADNQITPAAVILVETVAALGNSLAEVERCLASLRAMGSRVVTLAKAPVNPEAGPTGLALVDLRHQPGWQQAIALYDQQRQRRLRAGHARNRLQALPPPGKAPYGYRRGQGRYLVDRTAAPVITALVNEFLLYGSLRGAVRMIEARFGKRISASTGRRWLTHPVYRGDLLYQDGQIIRNTHGAIISREEAAQIDRLLRRNSLLPPRTAGAARSLAGLVSCQTCNSPLTVSKTTVRNQTHSYLYLRPTACPKAPRCGAIAYDQVLQATITQICQELPQAVAKGGATRPGGAPGAALRAQIQQKESALAQLPTLVDTGVLDAETAALGRYKLQGDMAELEQRLAQLPPVNLRELSQSVSIPQFWLDLSEAERRFFFREFIRRIQIVRDGQTWRIELILVI